MDTSGVNVILSEKQISHTQEKLEKAKITVEADKLQLLQDTYAELIRRTQQI